MEKQYRTKLTLEQAKNEQLTNIVNDLKEECSHLRASRNAHKMLLQITRETISEIDELSKTLNNKQLNSILNTYYNKVIN